MKNKTVLLFVLIVACVFFLSACQQNKEAAEEIKPVAPTEQPELLASDYDSAIDSSFSAGRLVLTEKEIPRPDPDTCVITAPPRSLQLPTGAPYPDETDIRNALRNGEWNVLAFSPDGQTQIGYLKAGEDTPQLPLLIRDNQVIMIYPSAKRGAPDTYGGMQDYYSKCYYNYTTPQKAVACPLGIGPDQLTWSPDGRYYYAENYALSALLTWSSHFIVDITTGEMIALDSFSLMRDTSKTDGAIWSGSFSTDGEYFYGAGPSNKYTDEWTNCVIRYDLETFEGTLLTETGSFYSGSSMRTLRDGTLLALFWDRSDQSVFWIRPDGTIQSLKESCYRSAKSIQYSPDSGWAVLTDWNQIIKQYATNIMPGEGLQLIRPDDGSAGIDLDSMLFVNNDTCVPEMASFNETFGIQADGEFDPSKIKQYQKYAYQFLDVVLSPNGRYVAILLYQRPPQSEATLMVVRLEDHAYLVAEGLVIDDTPPQNSRLTYPKHYFVYKRNSDYQPILNWTDAGLLVISSSSRLMKVEDDPLSFPVPEPEEADSSEGSEIH